MEKTFVNALAYSRILKLLTIFVLSFVVLADALIMALVVKVIDFASPEERTRITWLLALFLFSSAAGFPLFYFLHRSLRDQWIKTEDRGITYNSLTRKISASWDEVTGVSVVSRGRHSQALRIDTRRGRFYVLPVFVDKSIPIPKLKIGVSSRRLSYPNGRMKELDIESSDVYMELRNYIPYL